MTPQLEEALRRWAEAQDRATLDYVDYGALSTPTQNTLNKASSNLLTQIRAALPPRL
jgi:hypothetical protein